MSKSESPFIAAKLVNIEDDKLRKRFESQKRLSAKNEKPKKTGTIPTNALPTIGNVKATVLVIREYLAV